MPASYRNWLRAPFGQPVTNTANGADVPYEKNARLNFLNLRRTPLRKFGPREVAYRLHHQSQPSSASAAPQHSPRKKCDMYRPGAGRPEQ